METPGWFFDCGLLNTPAQHNWVAALGEFAILVGSTLHQPSGKIRSLPDRRIANSP